MEEKANRLNILIELIGIKDGRVNPNTFKELMSLDLASFDVVEGVAFLTGKGTKLLNELEADIFVEQIKEGLNASN